MDKHQEQLEFLGFIGILKESFKIILSNPKIFSKISLAFILPLTIIALIINEISNFLSNNEIPNTNSSSKWVLYWGLEAVCFIFIYVIIFSLLSISAVVYTAACIYSGKQITFKQVMRAIPKVWKRLIITLISNYCIVFVYTFVILLFSFITIYGISSTQVTTMIIMIIFGVLLFVGLIYISIFWQLAYVISVMEGHCGFGEEEQGIDQRQVWNCNSNNVAQGLCYVPILLLNRELLVKDNDIGIGVKILFAILILVLNPLQTLYNLVVQTVFYCVCKSYHHENIDKSNLSDHLEEFLGAHVPLLTETVEIV